MIRDGAAGVSRSLCRIEVAAAFLEDVYEELLHAAAVLGIFAAELIDHNGEGARYVVFGEAGAAHRRADANARRMRGRRGARIDHLAGDVDDAVADDADLGASRLVGSPKACASASLIARCEACFGCFRLRFLLRRRVLILRWRDGVLDG